MNSREKVSKTFKSLLSCTVKTFMDSFIVKVCHRIDFPLLIHDELSSLDSAMNIQEFIMQPEGLVPETRVHRKLTMIRSCHSHLNVIMLTSRPRYFIPQKLRET